jgi:hypothetical protein
MFSPEATLFDSLPLWRRLLLVTLIPFAALAGLVVVLAILVPALLWNALVYSVYWVRLKLTGNQIPPKGPVPPAISN